MILSKLKNSETYVLQLPMSSIRRASKKIRHVEKTSSTGLDRIDVQIDLLELQNKHKALIQQLQETDSELV